MECGQNKLIFLHSTDHIFDKEEIPKDAPNEVCLI